LTWPYLDALIDQIHILVAGRATPSLLEERWTDLRKPIRGSRREKLKQALLDHAKNAEGNLSSTFFDLCEEDISDITLLKNDRRVVDSLFCKLIESRNERGITWISKLFEAHGHFLSSYQPDYAFDEFKDRVKSALEDGKVSDRNRELLQSIAKWIGVSADALAAGK
jgi:hypothetical protein